MVQSNLNLNNNGITKEELQTLLLEANTAEVDLRTQLAKIKIHIDGNKSPELIAAITALFGPSYITSKGHSSLTYDMYCSVVNLIRTLGKNKAQEIL